MHALTAQPNASRYSDRLPGQQFDVTLTDSKSEARVSWAVLLRDGSNYFRQIVTIFAKGHDLTINRMQLLDLQIPGAHVVGSVKGSMEER